MGIPVHARWWVFILLAVGILLVLSLLALDRPDVVWVGESPECPHCRLEVRWYSHRCADCRGEFDWTSPAEEISPISGATLSPQEAEWVRDRVKALTAEVAAARVATALGLELAFAVEYLSSVAKGDCGWCGGTRLDPSDGSGEGLRCPACFGSGNGIACGGDRTMRIGDQRAARAYAAYDRELSDLMRSQVPDDIKRQGARRLAREFLASHEGTQEAQGIVFWPALLPGELNGHKHPGGMPTVVASRERLNLVLGALAD
ncbi:MAG: hypothetical protein O2894_11620 [Planctomycetota bacterium]|nr:hypothetical protein [Planctomycetota bacterium]